MFCIVPEPHRYQHINIETWMPLWIVTQQTPHANHLPPSISEALYKESGLFQTVNIEARVRLRLGRKGFLDQRDSELAGA